MGDRVTLTIKDQVNVKFDDLPPEVRRKISEACKYTVPYARHTPQFKLGRWDGKVAFATIGGSTFLNMLDKVLPLVIDAGYEIDIVDKRPSYEFQFPAITNDMLAHKVWPEGHPIAGQPIMLRDYQVEAIRRYLDHPQSIQSISTGAGKTLLTATLSSVCEAYGRTIVVVPNKSLVEQTEEDYRNLGLDVGVFYGDRKEWGHKHTIATWQSLGAFNKRDKLGNTEAGGSIMDFIDGVVCVMVDEVHSAKAEVLKDLLTGPMANIPIRWGLTGTVPKEEFEFKALEVSLGPVVGEIKASDLQEQGVLAKCQIEFLQLQDDHVAFKTYASEYDFLTSDRDRLDYLAEQFANISQSGNTLILVDRIECGKYLTSMLPDAVFINGTVKTKDRKKEYKSVHTADNKIVVATYGVAAVGINIPRIFNLILIEPGKSFVRVIQSIGRGIRVAEDKDFVQVYDVTTNLKFSAKHITERKKFYKEANYPFTLTKVKYR